MLFCDMARVMLRARICVIDVVSSMICAMLKPAILNPTILLEAYEAMAAAGG